MSFKYTLPASHPVYVTVAGKLIWIGTLGEFEKLGQEMIEKLMAEGGGSYEVSYGEISQEIFQEVLTATAVC